MTKNRKVTPKDFAFIAAILLLFLLNVHTSQRLVSLQKLIPQLRTFNSQLQKATETSIENIKAAGDNISKRVKKELNSNSEKLLQSRLNLYKTELSRISEEVERLQSKRTTEKRNLDRLRTGLPEYVDLDDLHQRYAKKKYSGESFITEKGTITFYSGQIQIITVPSTGKAAWIRIGKENSTEKAELIQAWLNESASSKIQQGYRLISNNTKPSDYGEYTIKLYRKGDMYLKTYYQYDRVQGTYGRYSHEYRYYIEVGSEKRKKQFSIEQYNSKTGS